MSKFTANTIIGAILIAGITVLFAGSLQRLAASVSGQGSTLSLKPAAFQYGIVESIGPDLAVGMLLVLLGLAVHAFFTLRRQPQKGGTTLRKMEVFHLHIFRR